MLLGHTILVMGKLLKPLTNRVSFAFKRSFDRVEDLGLLVLVLDSFFQVLFALVGNLCFTAFSVESMLIMHYFIGCLL